MNVPVSVTPEAQQAIDDITDGLLLGAGVPRAMRFLAAIRSLRERLADLPESGGGVIKVRGNNLRLQPLPGFQPYLMLSRFEGGRVEILDVFDGRRNHRMLRV